MSPTQPNVNDARVTRATCARPAPRVTPESSNVEFLAPFGISTEIEVRYFDEDGDGLLDAVETSEMQVASGPGFRHVLSERRTVLRGVGDDGTPHTVAVSSDGALGGISSGASTSPPRTLRSA